MNEQDGEGMIYTSGRRILVLKVTSWPLYQACRSQLRYNFTISQANLRKLFNFTPFSRRMLAHILYSGHTDMDAVSSNFSTFYTLPANDTRVPRAELTRREKKGREKKKTKKNIHSHVPGDNDRDSIREGCSRHLTRLRFATGMETMMAGQGRVLGWRFTKMRIYMLNEKFSKILVCCLYFFSFFW